MGCPLPTTTLFYQKFRKLFDDDREQIGSYVDAESSQLPSPLFWLRQCLNKELVYVYRGDSIGFPKHTELRGLQKDLSEEILDKIVFVLPTEAQP